MSDSLLSVILRLQRLSGRPLVTRYCPVSRGPVVLRLRGRIQTVSHRSRWLLPGLLQWALLG